MYVTETFKIKHRGAPDGLVRRQVKKVLCGVDHHFDFRDVQTKFNQDQVGASEFSATEEDLRRLEIVDCDVCMMRLATMAANDLVFDNAGLKRMLELLNG